MEETIDKGWRVMTLVYQSTRDAKNTVTASQAILQGLATMVVCLHRLLIQR